MNADGILQRFGRGSGFGMAAGSRLSEKFPDVFTEGFVGRSVAGGIDVMLEVVEQFVGGVVTFA